MFQPWGAALALLLAGCATDNAVPTLDILDETTGMTAGVLASPIAFLETGIDVDVANPTPIQASLAYVDLSSGIGAARCNIAVGADCAGRGRPSSR